MNRNLTEAMAVYVAKRRDAYPETLTLLTRDVRFRDSYGLKTTVCRNPKTPHKVALGLLKHLRIFDLSDVARDRHLNIMFRQRVEQIISEKIPSLPAGIKISLARKTSPNIVTAMLEDSTDTKVINACLDSPVTTEAQIYKVINRTKTAPAVIRSIAEHPKWSLRYNIKFALVRNFYTPMVLSWKFMRALKINDLRDLFADPKLPISTRPFIFRELRDRGVSTDVEEDASFVLPEYEE